MHGDDRVPYTDMMMAAGGILTLFRAINIHAEKIFNTVIKCYLKRRRQFLKFAMLQELVVLQNGFKRMLWFCYHTHKKIQLLCTCHIIDLR